MSGITESPILSTSTHNCSCLCDWQPAPANIPPSAWIKSVDASSLKAEHLRFKATPEGSDLVRKGLQHFVWLVAIQDK